MDFGRPGAGSALSAPGSPTLRRRMAAVETLALTTIGRLESAGSADAATVERGRGECELAVSRRLTNMSDDEGKSGSVFKLAVVNGEEGVFPA
jgi:hypothetical protein